jgi:signal transduction histidine kinase
MLDQVEIRDLEGDGSKEIILSTGGLNNGAVLNDTDDAHAYVIVLDCNGNERWKEKIGGWYTFARSLAVKDLDHDGTLEIIIATDTHRAHPAVKGTIFVFDALTGKKRKSYSLAHASFSRFFIRDYGPGDTRIYVGDGSGCIRMFDRDLNLRKIIRENSPVFVLNGAAPSKKWNFLLAITHDRLLAFDWELKRKVFGCRFERPDRTNVSLISRILVPFDTHRGIEALIFADKLYRLREVDVSVFAAVKNMVTSGLLLVVLGLFLFNGFAAYAARRLNTSAHSFPYGLRRKGAALTPRFLDIVREIVQQVKTPISTISWTAEKIKQTNDTVKEEKTRESFRQLSGFLGDDVKILKQQANRLLRLVQIYKPCFREIALKPFLENVLDHYRAVVDEKITIRLEMEEDISLSLDPELFKEALLNLVDNALAAMPAAGKLTVSAVPVTSHLKGAVKEVLIEVEDTGHGIEAEDLHRVFDPFFTGKPKGGGTGIGLTICRRIIDVHGGTIEIHSRKHFGTKTVITIPAGAGSAGGTGTADR